MSTHKSQQTLAVPDGPTAAWEAHQEDEGTESNQEVGSIPEVFLIRGVDDVNVVLKVGVYKEPDAHSQDGHARKLKHIQIQCGQH